MAESGPKELPGFARFCVALLGLVLFLSGAGLVIAGSSEAFSLGPVPAETPGLAVIVLSFYAMYRSGRRAKGEVEDPDSHRVLPRDIEDHLESLDDEDRDD